MKRIDAMAMSLSGGIVAAACMLLLGIFGNIGIYTGAVEMMEAWHMYFSLSMVGIITGMIEAFVITFVLLYALVYLYNRLAPNT